MSDLNLDRALLVVHALDPLTGGPVVPPTWKSTAVGGGWYVITPPAGFDDAVAYRANVDPAGTRVLLAVLGPPATLAVIEAAADLAMPAKEAWRRRAEPGVLLYLRSWPAYLCAGFERDMAGAAVPFSGVRRLLDEGGRLPDYTTTPLPWNLTPLGALTTQALARYRVTSITRPVLDATLAGLDCNGKIDDEPDPA